MRQPTAPFWQVSVWKDQQVIGLAEIGTPVYAHWWELELYKQYGYHEQDHTFISELDLTQFDLAAHIPSLVKAQKAGVILKSLAELIAEQGEFDEALQRRLYDLFCMLLSDVPSDPPMTIWPFEDWQQRSVAEMKHKKGIWLAIAPEGNLVGVIEAHRSREQEGRLGLSNGLTGVHPAWHGKDIAKALKVAAYRSATEHGHQFIRTINHKRNLIILKMNQELGFEIKVNRVLMVKNLQEKANL